MIDDVTMVSAQRALDGLAERQRVSADNIANVSTPGFLAGRVDFEDDLRSAMSNGTAPAADDYSVQRSLEPTRIDGNNVNLDSETMISTETGLRYELALRVLDGKYNVLRAAMKVT